MSSYDKVLEMVESWRAEIESPEEGGKLKEILDYLGYLERVKFQPFLPTLYSTRHAASFMERLYAWLNNPGLSESAKRNLFQFAEHIAYFSFDDFAALFQNAFSGPITRWCMDQADISFTASNWSQRLDEERYNKTWFCPVTDSFLISLFHHVNEITDKERKPSFRDLAEFGDPDSVMTHISKRGYSRLVLLEDFVGTGTQAMKAVKWALKHLPIPILFCPIVVGKEGIDCYSKLKKSMENGGHKSFNCPSFEFEPIFTLDEECFVKNGDGEVCALFTSISDLAQDIHTSLEAINAHCAKGAHGFCTSNSKLYGATAVMFSNTPNNSLPLIWHEAESHWNPLFPRVARQPL